MANEAVIIELLGDGGDVVEFTVPDAIGIEKCSVLGLSGGTQNRTAYFPSTNATTVGTVMIAGIASTEKVASDGATTLGCYTHGIFDLKNNGEFAIVQGDAVGISGQNMICPITEKQAISGCYLGKALEDIAVNGTGEVLVRI